MRSVIALSLLMTAAPALAENNAPASDASQQTASAPKEKMICRRESTIGSNIRGKKVCVSIRDYEAQQEAARAQAKTMTTASGHSSGN